jgi:hypothetical protein
MSEWIKSSLWVPPSIIILTGKKLISRLVAYMYLGQAIRTCLSAGFNREPTDNKKMEGEVVSTWWYVADSQLCVQMTDEWQGLVFPRHVRDLAPLWITATDRNIREMSFSLGRPDSLGLDEYHNRCLPEIDNTEYAIISCMVDFGRIIRKVAVRIYHSRISLQQKFSAALEIESEMNGWVARLPSKIRPSLGLEGSRDSGLREPKWCRRQRLVLGIRRSMSSIRFIST